jgi:hypothetical protein
LALAWKPRSDTKARQPALAGARVNQSVGRLDVLVDNSTLMQLTDCSAKANCEAQENPQVSEGREGVGLLQRLTEQLI